MKEIQLNHGLVSMVDDQDYDALCGSRWFATHHKGKRYAAITVCENGKSKRVYLHRLISVAPKGMVVDHIDGNPLNNCRANLRVCKQTDNARNRVGGRSSSGLKGVWKGDPRCVTNPWVSYITVNRRAISLGSFPTKELAARAYDTAAILHFGEFAKTNASMGLLPCQSGTL